MTKRLWSEIYDIYPEDGGGGLVAFITTVTVKQGRREPESTRCDIRVQPLFKRWI